MWLDLPQPISSSASGQSTSMLHFLDKLIQEPFLHLNSFGKHLINFSQSSSSLPSMHSLFPSHLHSFSMHLPSMPALPVLQPNSNGVQFAFVDCLQNDCSSSLLSPQSLSPSQAQEAWMHFLLLQENSVLLQLFGARMIKMFIEKPMNMSDDEQKN